MGTTAPASLEIITADITTLSVDAIVNAANTSLLGGGEKGLLASCDRNALALAADNGCRTIAFPAISTGVYGFPAGPAARIAVSTVEETVVTNPASYDRIVFCCFDEDSAAHHQAAIDKLGT